MKPCAGTSNVHRIALTRVPVTLVLVMVLFIAATPCSGQGCPGAAEEGWDSGSLNLWHGLVSTVVSVTAIGGNPGGYLEAVKTTGGFVPFGNQSPPWNSDWVAGQIREISIDVNVFGADLIVGPTFRIRKDATVDGWYYVISGSLTDDSQWRTFTAPISPTWSDAQAIAAGWWTPPGDEPSFIETLTAMQTLSISLSGVPASHAVGFDNAKISCGIFEDDFESGDTNAWSVVEG